jgi:hypothetical protein
MLTLSAEEVSKSLVFCTVRFAFVSFSCPEIDYGSYRGREVSFFRVHD